MKTKLILVFGTIVIILFSCKTEEIILHGEITGLVTDTTTSQPLKAMAIKLNPLNDTTSTGIDGKYLFKSLIPGGYKIEASKPPYAKSTKKAAVTSGSTTEINFALNKISYPRFSERLLDFGFDSTLKSFTITNTGTGKLTYFLNASQGWITVRPKNGEARTETDTIKVTINRTGLSDKKHLESIEVDSYVGQDIVRDSIGVYLNGIFDCDSNYYSIVTIGTQTWMSENLNVGKVIPITQEPKKDEFKEKWYYGLKTYGGLYSWNEMMNYNPPDFGAIGTTQGICPVGWHIPTRTEVIALVSYLGGNDIAGGKLKEIGTTHWMPPNKDATDEYGFTALPDGFLGRGTDPNYPDVYDSNPLHNRFYRIGEAAYFWESYWEDSPEQRGGYFNMGTSDPFCIFSGTWPSSWGCSVRCIKDPPKNK